MADRFDLDAIDADDALLDLLAAGGETAFGAGEHDPAVKLLAELRLAVEVEDELPVETIDDPESFLARCAALNPVTDPFARKVAARGLALGVAAVAALSVSGVAAAVTGDPLSPYEKVIEKMVDAVRPQTSFPKEQLDGMPVVDKTKIVKVAKDYQKKQEEKAAEEKAKSDETVAADQLPQATTDVNPPLARPLPKELPSIIQQPVVPPDTQTTQPPDQAGDGQADEPGSDPTQDPTTDPTTDPTQDPTTDPTTPPPTDPTTPPATEPTDPPPTTPDNGETGTDTGNPTTPPSGDSGTGAGDSSTGSGDSSTGDAGSGNGSQTVPGDTNPAPDQPGDEQKPSTDQPGDNAPGDGQSGDDQTPAGGLGDLLEKILPVLPTPTGAPAELKSADEFFSSSTDAKHSSGAVSTGSVKSSYVKGKHSTGQYAEGKHAAIERTHGSLEDQAVLQILGVVNKQTN
ncbi:hypothetical protein E0H75_39975 [Kribbella capetownensis]|uniref:Anti-sigma-D factor RsdA sigma factor binding region domain-containing protein n=1 Tax=Kribbella capetownensis TaxID=1572659 RepID=A0A4V2M5C1_9ACTN|nr:hypothetical protein [Kribbella capetownensis]TCC39162.1 hypothetical protein E0H75_39975 [Kribbella capetownensis]